MRRFMAANSGLAQRSEFGSGDYYAMLDPIGALMPPLGGSVYYKMMSNDPVIGGLLLHLRGVLSSVSWEFMGIDKEVVAVLRRVKDDLFNAVIYGFYVGELVWSVDGLRDIFPVPPTGIQEIGRDKIVCSEFDLPRKKSVLVTFGSESRSPYGQSVLRHCYKPWYYKTITEENEMLGLGRFLRGMPVISAPEGVSFAMADKSAGALYDPDIAYTIDMMQQIVSNIYDGKQKGAVLPHGWNLSYPAPADKTFDVSGTIKRYNTEMCLALVDTVISDGTRGRSGALLDAVNYVVKVFVEGFNGEILPRLTQLGFIGSDAEVKASLLRHYDLAELASYIARLVKAEVIDVTDELKEKVLIYGKL